MTRAALAAAIDAAAYAGKLAGIACEALFEYLLPSETPTEPDEFDFDEAAAARYLAEGNGSYSLVDVAKAGERLWGDRLGPLPPADETVLRSGGQTYEYGPRPRISVPRPPVKTPSEPALTDVELIALRQLIEERFGLPTSADGVACTARGPAAEDAPHRQDAPLSGGAGHPNTPHR